ncbi:hypothetical protein HYO62_07060 [Aerococcaceae bacterium DSM 111022]|nr:hypothetical protein [Aerococcaceae bacterium DSM 111022]
MDLLPLILLGIGWFISFRNATRKRKEEAEKLNAKKYERNVNQRPTRSNQTRSLKPAQSSKSSHEKSDYLQTVLSQVQEITEDKATGERINTYQKRIQKRHNEGVQARSTVADSKTTTKEHTMSSRPSLSKEMSIEESLRLKQDRLAKKQQNLTQKSRSNKTNKTSQPNTRTVFGEDDFYERLMSGELDQEIEVERQGRKSVKTLKVDNKELRRAVIMKEVLDKPVSLK